MSGAECGLERKAGTAACQIYFQKRGKQVDEDLI
jgi:hypothetical protein